MLWEIQDYPGYVDHVDSVTHLEFCAAEIHRCSQTVASVLTDAGVNSTRAVSVLMWVGRLSPCSRLSELIDSLLINWLDFRDGADLYISAMILMRQPSRLVTDKFCCETVCHHNNLPLIASRICFTFLSFQDEI